MVVDRSSQPKSRRKGDRHYVGGMAKWALSHLPAWGKHPSNRVVVLCYHSVHAHTHWASATPRLFEEQIAWLLENCEVIPLASVQQQALNPNLKRPSVAITFDDGYSDNFQYALPILLRYGIQATFFVTTGLVEGNPEVVERIRNVWNASAEEISALTWSQIIEMRDAGMGIGSHTVSHRNLARVGDDAALRELSRAKDSLEDHLGDQVVSVAYPFGIPKRHISDKTLEIARFVGYEIGVAVLFRSVRSSDLPLAIPRLSVTGDSLQMLRAKVIGKLDFVGLWQEHAPSWASRLISSDISDQPL
jgi:peptidoglycan/xylan/chitin deacetylase (PgdA/CDA1 family)